MKKGSEKSDEVSTMTEFSKQSVKIIGALVAAESLRLAKPDLDFRSRLLAGYIFVRAMDFLLSTFMKLAAEGAKKGADEKKTR